MQYTPGMEQPDLVEDVWRKIFCTFPSPQRAQLAQVCKQWQHIILNPKSWKDVEFIQQKKGGSGGFGSSSSNESRAAVVSFFNFLSKYCTTAEEVVIEADIGPGCKLDHVFQIRTLRRLKLAIEADGVNSFLINLPISCKDLEILNINQGGGLIPNLSSILRELPNIKELYLDFFYRHLLSDFLPLTKKLERISIKEGPTGVIEDEIRISNTNVKLVIVVADHHRRYEANSEPMRINNTLVVREVAFSLSGVSQYLRHFEGLLYPSEAATILNSLTGSSNFKDEELIRFVKNNKISVNATEGESFLRFRPNFLNIDTRSTDYPLKVAVKTRLPERISTLKLLGADMNSPILDDSPLLHAKSNDIYKHLLNEGADPNKLINGIPVFMYLVLSSPRSMMAASSAGPSVDVEKVLPALSEHHCDFNKKYRGRSFVDLALYEHQRGSIISAIIRCTSVQWTPDQLSQLFFKNYVEARSTFLYRAVLTSSIQFESVISKPEFNLSLLKLPTVVAAFVKNPSDTRLRDIIVNQKDLVWDELGLTIAHYVALSSAIGKSNEFGQFSRTSHVDSYSTRWKMLGMPGNNLTFKKMPGPFTPVPIPSVSLVSTMPPQQSSGFSFGSSSVSQQTPTQSGGFTFGAAPPPQPTGLSFGTPTTLQPSGVSFGSSPFPPSPPLQHSPSLPKFTGFKLAAPTVTQQTSPQPAGLSFSAPAPPQQPSSFSFGSSYRPKQTLQPQSGGFSFGTESEKPTPTTPQPNGFSFGASTAQQTPSQSSGFSFGSSSIPQKTPSQSSGFSFGPSTQSQPQPGGFGTQTVVTPQTGYKFGDSAAQWTPQTNRMDNTPPVMASSFSFSTLQPNADSFTFGAPSMSTQVASTQLIEDFFTSHKDALNSASTVGETPLLVLCKVAIPQKMKLEGVRQLLKVGGVDVNRADKNGWTPLHAALLSSEFEIAKLLLEHGANINAQDGFGITPLMSWFYGYNYRGLTVDLKTYYEDTTFLLQQKDIDFTLTDTHFNRSVIHLMACFAPPSLLDLVLKSGASQVVLEARDTEGFTPLHHAVMFCNYDMMSYLIEKGANVNAQSYALKLTPLMIFFAIHNCAQSPHLHWLEHCNTIMLGRVIASDLPSAKESHKYFTFLEPGWIAQSRKSPKFCYAAMGNTSENHKDWKFLATDKTDLTLADRFGNTLLHLVVKRNNMFENGELWSELDFLWNHRNAKGETPFHLLAKDTEMNKQIAKHFAQFKELIGKGKIDLFIEDNKGSYGLELLLTTTPLSVEQKQQLVALSKKDPNRVRNQVPPPLKKSSQRSLLHALLQTRAEISINLMRSIITQFNHEVNAQDEDGNTPLMSLLSRYYNDIPRPQQHTTRVPLKQQEIDPNELVKVDEDPSKLFPFVEYLMACPGADFSIQNNAGDTALHIVCRHFHVGALEALWCQFNSFDQAAKYCLVAFKLIAGGAQVTIKNNAGETAVDYAPMLMYHYQSVYPRIKDYKIPQQTKESVQGQYDLSHFDRE